MARSARAAANRHPANPTSLEHLSIPPSYLITASGDNLLLWDSEYSSSLRRSYLFGTPSNLEVLGSCNNLVIDGTFKVAPSLFTQLLTIHGITTDHYRMPLAYGLLPGKRQEHYNNLLEELDPLLRVHLDRNTESACSLRPLTWNQYDCSLAGLPRSSHLAEGWHNGDVMPKRVMLYDKKVKITRYTQPVKHHHMVNNI